MSETPAADGYYITLPGTDVETFVKLEHPGHDALIAATLENLARARAVNPSLIDALEQLADNISAGLRERLVGIPPEDIARVLIETQAQTGALIAHLGLTGYLSASTILALKIGGHVG